MERRRNQLYPFHGGGCHLYKSRTGGTKRSWRRALLTWNENMGDGNNPILHTSHELRIYRGQFDKK